MCGKLQAPLALTSLVLRGIRVNPASICGRDPVTHQRGLGHPWVRCAGLPGCPPGTLYDQQAQHMGGCWKEGVCRLLCCEQGVATGDLQGEEQQGIFRATAGHDASSPGLMDFRRCLVLGGGGLRNRPATWSPGARAGSVAYGLHIEGCGMQHMMQRIDHARLHESCGSAASHVRMAVIAEGV